MMVRVVRILLADDHRMFRQGLRRLLSDHPDFAVVAEASSCDEACELGEREDVDLAVLDLSMPGGDGVEVIARLRALRPKLKILVVTMHAEAHLVLRALRAGANGYMTKDDAAEELAGVIRAIALGGRHVNSAVAESIALGLASQDEGRHAHERLSGRETEVFEMLIAGKRGFEIAQALALSEKTVSTHKSHVLRKLHLENDTQLVLYAVRHQLLHP